MMKKNRIYNKKTPNTFTAISGFKRISKCRLCGKRVTSEKETNYCPECQEKVRHD